MTKYIEREAFEKALCDERDKIPRDAKDRYLNGKRDAFIEDSDLTLEDLAARGIPQGVLSLVDNLTRREGERYFDYIRRVKQSPDAAKIKLADLIHNADLGRLDCVTDADRSRQRRYLKAIRILTEEGDDAV